MPVRAAGAGRDADCSSSPNTDPGPNQLPRFGCTLTSCSVLAVHTDLTRAGSETTTDRPKNGTLISKMWPCRLIQFRIAVRRKKANPTPCTSLGKRTGGGFNLFGVDVSHGLAMAGWVIRESSLARGCTISVVRYCNLGSLTLT